MFYPNELIKSWQLDTNPLRSIIAKCRVEYVTVSGTFVAWLKCVSRWLAGIYARAALKRQRRRRVRL